LCPHISCFSIRSFSYLQFTTAQKENSEIKEINSS
jgi:hypothetical protein